MTDRRRQELKAELDRRAREAQPAYDEIEAVIDGRVFDTHARELMLDANLGLAIGAAHTEGESDD